MREHRLCYDSPARYVSGGVLICVCFVPAAQTPEHGLGFSVALVDMPAFRAFPAGVSRVDSYNRDASLLGFVLDKSSKLAEAPIVQTFPLLFVGLTAGADVREVFQHDT